MFQVRSPYVKKYLILAPAKTCNKNKRPQISLINHDHFQNPSLRFLSAAFAFLFFFFVFSLIFTSLRVLNCSIRLFRFLLNYFAGEKLNVYSIRTKVPFIFPFKSVRGKLSTILWSVSKPLPPPRSAPISFEFASLFWFVSNVMQLCCLFRE